MTKGKGRKIAKPMVRATNISRIAILPLVNLLNRKPCLMLVLLILLVAPSFAATCESLATLKLPDTTITSAQAGRSRSIHTPGLYSAASLGKKFAGILPRHGDAQAGPGL